MNKRSSQVLDLSRFWTLFKQTKLYKPRTICARLSNAQTGLICRTLFTTDGVDWHFRRSLATLKKHYEATTKRDYATETFAFPSYTRMRSIGLALERALGLSDKAN